MTSVTEDLLNRWAANIATDFVDNQIPLNTGVKEKVAAAQLNRDQTERLVEKTNTEAFLKLFPTKTAFIVADTRIVLGEELETTKVASVTADMYDQYTPSSFADRLAIRDVFGSNHFKVACDNNFMLSKRLELLDKVESLRAEDDRRMLKTAADVNLNQAGIAFEKAVKMAMATGTGLDKIELSLYNAFPANSVEVAAIFDELQPKFAKERPHDTNLLKRARVEDYNEHAVVAPTAAIDAFEELMNIASVQI